MIISKLRYMPTNIHLVGDEGTIEMGYSAWQDFLSARGAVSFPFAIDFNTENVANLFDNHKRVTITNARRVS